MPQDGIYGHAGDQRGQRQDRGVDLMTATGLADRLDGVEAVTGVMGTGSLSARKAIRFFDLAIGHDTPPL